MTENQYKEGLLALLEIFQEINEAETFSEIDKLTFYGETMIKEAILSLTKTDKVLH